jgi:uncharacterized membrane protein YecN with MAPEG domain
MMSPPMPAITALYAALVALLLVVLALRISRFRMRLGVGIGDGGDQPLSRAIRVHANAVEWAVPVLLLLLVAELNRAAPLLLHVCGIALIVGRVLHGIALGRRSGPSPGRFAGIMITWIVLLVLAAWDLWAFVRTLSV